MTDLQIAKSGLTGHTVCLCKGGKTIVSDKRGISPIMDFIAEGVDLRGYAVADLVVGKAVAMLFARCGISAVFAKTLSYGGKAVLENYEIPFGYETLTEKIINRAGNDICPMEKAVASTEDLEEAYALLKEKISRTE